MLIDASLTLRALPPAIAPAVQFAHCWALGAGLSRQGADRLALAVDELVTDIVLYAFGDDDGEFDMSFGRDGEALEIVVKELGEPFDPNRHLYSPEAAVDSCDFDGAGFALIRHCVDDFVFLNQAPRGKEFRLVVHVDAAHIAEIATPNCAATESMPEIAYDIEVMAAADAEDVSKLIYRTYGYSYHKSYMYFPAKVEQALARNEKFGVLARAANGEPAGMFAVLHSTDSRIGEVGEAVVSIPHRKRGLMTRMLQGLITEATDRGLFGLYGEAVAAHAISQKVNHKLGFHSTALILCDAPGLEFKGIKKNGGQGISVVIDFLPLQPYGAITVHLPDAYAKIVTAIYERLGAQVSVAHGYEHLPDGESAVDVRIHYIKRRATIVAHELCRDLDVVVRGILDDLRAHDIINADIDLPLDNACIGSASDCLRQMGFIFCGLMPRFHAERDYLRLQWISEDVDFSEIMAFSPTAQAIKACIEAEYQDLEGMVHAD
jgi:anti-sigma regulatory factor (Ser/Thr protein kinase)/L-amino acid N-acyltransferase YncA